MIEIYLLEQLAAVAEHGTLIKAAEALYLSQPALSRSMKKLETQLGVSLFDRDNSKITLNKTGQYAVEYARRILELDREMCEGVADFDRRQRTVSVGACAPFPLGELTPVIQERFVEMAVTTELATMKNCSPDCATARISSSSFTKSRRGGICSVSIILRKSSLSYCRRIIRSPKEKASPSTICGNTRCCSSAVSASGWRSAASGLTPKNLSSRTIWTRCLN